MINPHAPPKTSLLSMFEALWNHRALIVQLSTREVAGRYRGSFIGVGWSFVVPILLLVVYTFVFSVVFRARWMGGGSESRADFALMIFAGLIIHGLFAECLSRAPYLILQNANYVKKVVFPLHVLPWIVMGSALFHAAVGLLVLLGAQIVMGRPLAWTVLLVPVAILPLVLTTVGLMWFLGALGVYLRDIGQAMGPIVSVAMFMSPVFYPISAVPEDLRFLLWLNPITPAIEHVRGAVLLGTIPNPVDVGAGMAAGCLAAWLGYWWFQRARKGFADVI